MKTLLEERKYDQANIRDNKGRTPLLVAIEKGNLEGVQILLKYMPDETKRDPNVYQRLLYEVSTPEKGVSKKRIRKSILDALMKDQGTFNEAFLWAIAKFERHEIAKELLLWNPDSETNERQSSPESSVIELATQQKKPDVLWWLIATSPRTRKITKSIESALSKAKTEEARVVRNAVDRILPGRKPKNQHIVLRHMIDILENPQIAHIYEDSEILEPPRLKHEHSNSVQEFKALIARFYKAKHVSSTIRRTRDLKDTVYGEGPTRIMTKAISDLNNTMKRFENKSNNAKSSRLQATYGEDNLRFTYIHLPATNVRVPVHPKWLLLTKNRSIG